MGSNPRRRRRILQPAHLPHISNAGDDAKSGQSCGFEMPGGGADALCDVRSPRRADPGPAGRRCWGWRDPRRCPGLKNCSPLGLGNTGASPMGRGESVEAFAGPEFSVTTKSARNVSSKVDNPVRRSGNTDVTHPPTAPLPSLSTHPGDGWNILVRHPMRDARAKGL